MTDTITITVQVGGGAAQSFDLAQTAEDAAPPPDIAGTETSVDGSAGAAPPPPMEAGAGSDSSDGPAAPPGLDAMDADADEGDMDSLDVDDDGDVPPPEV